MLPPTPPFSLGTLTPPIGRDRRRWLRRLARPRWAHMLSHNPAPISNMVGQDRGLPVDRLFIEAFLNHHKKLITGDVLDIKDREYTDQFGQGVTSCQVLDYNRENKAATIYDDIRSLSTIKDATFDCFIITQVLQYIDDLHASAKAIHRVLRPGGTALITVPSLGKLDGTEDNVEGSFWRFTADSCRYLFAPHFRDLEIVPWGNVRLAMAFLTGLSAQDMTTHELRHFDARFTTGVLIRATKDR